jgi:glycosyltransferase involved in cell wall biosynthesis
MGGGGAERALSQLAGPLSSAGCDVHVALLRGGFHEERLASSGATIHRIGIRGNYDPRIVWSIDKIVRRVRPDILQTWLTQMDVAGGVVARLHKVPWILSERSSAAAYDGGAKDVLRIAVAGGARLIQANSKGGADFWAEKRPRIPRVVVPNPLPLAEIASAPPADVQRFEGRPVILYVGRLVKNTAHLVAAMQDVPDAVLVMLGESGESEVRQWIEERNLAGRVVLEGFVCDVWSRMKSAALVVSVSTFEGLPNVVLEAAAAGTPLVLSDIPAHRDLLGACNGALFVDGNDPRSIAAGIHETLRDRAAAEQRARNAYAAVSSCTPEVVAAEQMRVYEDLLAHNKHP